MALTTSMSTFHSCILLLLITWLCNAPSPSLSQSQTQTQSEQCRPRDKKALLQIKQDLGNPSLLSSWDPTTDCCGNTWDNVLCTPEKPHGVYYLNLNGLDLPGPANVPPSLGYLSDLDTLVMMDMPNLIGPIPHSFTNLKKLEVLYIFNTNVSGPIPGFLAQIKTLMSLELSNNNHSGPLPPSLSQLPNARVIFINSNKLTGPIPDSYGYFSKNLTSLSLSQNMLSGKIPASLGRLDASLLDLSWNKLEGDASMLFGAEKTADVIDLSRNLLSFDVGKVEFGRNISKLNLRRNRIYGKLPEELTKLQHLRRLNVSYNNLCGEIPQGGNLQLFDASSFAHNKCLCGSPLPSCKGGQPTGPKL